MAVKAPAPRVLAEGAEHKVLPPPSRLVVEDGKAYVEIAGRRIPIGGPLPRLKPGEKHVRVVSTLCPYCQRLLPGRIVERDGKIYIRRVCPEHGEIEELYYGDSKLYYRMMQYEETGKGVTGVHAYVGIGGPCPFSCGLCAMHENHTALANLVVTNRCDLSCFYCFFYAEKAGYVYEPSLESLRMQVRQLKKQGVTMAVQITGGEPTMRDDLVEIVKMLKEEGVRHVQLNTNGIKFAKLFFEDPEKAVEYARSLRQAGVNTVYMSFDGVTPKSNWKNHWEAPFTLEVFRRSGMTSVVLVPTVIRGMNTHELGDIIRFAAKHMDVVRSVNFQPVSLSGQLKKHERERMRVTIADAINMIAEQTDNQIYPEAWYPIPVAAKFAKFIEAWTGEPQFCMSNHPMCGVGTYIYVVRGSNGLPEKLVPITDFFDVDSFVEWLDEKRLYLLEGKSKRMLVLKGIIDFRKFVKKKNLPDGLNVVTLLKSIVLRRNYDVLGKFHYNFMFLGMMHFMDQYNYDVTRVRRCNIHYLSPDGRVIPFCTYNVLDDIYRDHILKQYKTPLEAYEREVKLKGFNPGEKYNRSKYYKLIKNHPIYKEAYRGILW